MQPEAQISNSQGRQGSMVIHPFKSTQMRYRDMPATKKKSGNFTSFVKIYHHFFLPFPQSSQFQCSPKQILCFQEFQGHTSDTN